MTSRKIFETKWNESTFIFPINFITAFHCSAIKKKCQRKRDSSIIGVGWMDGLDVINGRCLNSKFSLFRWKIWFENVLTLSLRISLVLGLCSSWRRRPYKYAYAVILYENVGQRHLSLNLSVFFFQMELLDIVLSSNVYKT